MSDLSVVSSVGVITGAKPNNDARLEKVVAEIDKQEGISPQDKASLKDIAAKAFAPGELTLTEPEKKAIAPFISAAKTDPSFSKDERATLQGIDKDLSKSGNVSVSGSGKSLIGRILEAIGNFFKKIFEFFSSAFSSKDSSSISSAQGKSLPNFPIETPNTQRTSQEEELRPFEELQKEAQKGSLLADAKNFYVSQNGNQLASGGGDCGPASASMVLKRFGIFEKEKSSADSILAVRDEVDVTKSRSGAWAIDESEVKQAIEGLSKGKVKQTDSGVFNGNQVAELTSFIKDQITNKKAMPILETGTPYSSDSRHYMVALEVRDNGNIVVADPAGKQIWEITPARLKELMEKADNRGGSHVLAFNQVQPKQEILQPLPQ